jgi:hypothetical protein
LPSSALAQFFTTHPPINRPSRNSFNYEFKAFKYGLLSSKWKTTSLDCNFVQFIPVFANFEHKSYLLFSWGYPHQKPVVFCETLRGFVDKIRPGWRQVAVECSANSCICVNFPRPVIWWMSLTWCRRCHSCDHNYEPRMKLWGRLVFL